MNPLIKLAACATPLLALSACAMFPGANDPVRDDQHVSIVNSLSWTDPLSGKRDGRRSSWPLKQLPGQEEVFPLAQLKQCDPVGVCAWGVLRASRTLANVRYRPNGVQLDLTVAVDVDRRQAENSTAHQAAIAIPSDVATLRLNKKVQRSLTLEYGTVQHIEFDYGISFDLCVLRYDGAGKPLDTCGIAYI